MQQPPVTHMFRGHRYRLVPYHAKKAKTHGDCDAPRCLDKQMRIPTRGTTRKELTVIIHEALHACMWDLSEEAVDETSQDIARLIWRLNWRKVEM